MKPQSVEQTYKQQGWIPLSTFAFVDTVPSEMRYTDHLLGYEGSDGDMSLPWGVYGTTSLTALSFHASQRARGARKVMLCLSLWYYVEELKKSTTRVPHSIDEAGAFLHLGRLGSDLRGSLHDELLSMLAETRSRVQMEALRKLDWPSLMLQEPATVRRLLYRYPSVDLVVHPVRQGFTPGEEEVVLIGSFRLDPSRVKAIEARYFSDVAVSI